MIVNNIYGWRGVEETGLGDDSPPARAPCGKFKVEGLTSIMIFIQKHVAKFLTKG